MPSIVVIDDDAATRALLENGLTAEGYTVHTADERDAGFQKILALTPAVVIASADESGLDGLGICRDSQNTPAIAHIPFIISVRDNKSDARIAALEAGAEDCLCKPFSLRELALRIKIILRRHTVPLPVPSLADCLSTGPVRVGGLTLIPDAHAVFINNIPTALTATEFRLLAELLHHQGKVRSRESLLRHVWGYSVKGYARTVDTHIRRLRQKLGLYACWIETLRGVGYRFRGEEEGERESAVTL